MQTKAKRWLVTLLTVLLLISFTNVADAKGNKARTTAKPVKGKLVSVGKDSITVKVHHKKKGAAAQPATKKAGKGKKGAKGKNKGGTTFKTTHKTKVTLNGKKAKLASLTPGLKVKVKESGGTAKKIKARSPHKGTTTTTTTAPVTPTKVQPAVHKKKKGNK
jgi:hypothetical protein